MNRCARGAVIVLASATLCGCIRGGAVSGDTGPQGPQGVSAKMASTADLKDKRIGVVLGTVHDTLATKLYPKATVLHYDSPTDLTLAVMSGKVDAALSDAEPLAERLRTNGALAVLGEPLVSLPIAAGFRKDNIALRDQFNRFLSQIKHDGVHAGMVSRWLLTHDTEMPDLAVSNPRGTLVIGVSGSGLPFAAVKDGVLVGFDIELIQRFAAHLGRSVTFLQMPFASLIAATASGKVDMIAASIFITDERKQRIDFSDPYHEAAVVVYALRSNLAAGAATATSGPGRDSFLDRVLSSFQSNIVHEKRYLLLWDGLKATAIIAVMATLLGTALGALVCFMRMSRLAVLNVPARIYITVLRGTPIVVLLLITFYVVFGSVNINPILVAIMAFGMNFAAYVSEIFRSGVESVDKGQFEAGTAMGFTRAQTLRFIVLPQMVRRTLPVYKGEFISLVKMTSVVGYIAVQDLTKASDIIRSRTFDAFFPLIIVAVLYFLISWSLMLSLEYVERITDPKYRRRKANAR